MSDDPWDEATAGGYDDPDDPANDPATIAPMVDGLVELAAGGPALELAIGTGRVALPLAARGVRVSGIELSAPMVARLRAKPGGDEASIPVTIGDMATTRAPGAGTCSLVYLVYNTIMNLVTQDAQVACFVNAAAHLAPGGRFVIETIVPDLRRLLPGERFVVFDLDDTHVGVDEYEPLTQGLVSHHTTTRDGVTERSSGAFRYVWPSELDLMARIAGLVPVARWADWSRAPFTAESRSHVSVWQRPAGGG
jgi:SAM-dependent methyltransferase